MNDMINICPVCGRTDVLTPGQINHCKRSHKQMQKLELDNKKVFMLGPILKPKLTIQEKYAKI